MAAPGVLDSFKTVSIAVCKAGIELISLLVSAPDGIAVAIANIEQEKTEKPNRRDRTQRNAKENGEDKLNDELIQRGKAATGTFNDRWTRMSTDLQKRMKQTKADRKTVTVAAALMTIQSDRAIREMSLAFWPEKSF